MDFEHASLMCCYSEKSTAYPTAFCRSASSVQILCNCANIQLRTETNTYSEHSSKWCKVHWTETFMPNEFEIGMKSLLNCALNINWKSCFFFLSEKSIGFQWVKKSEEKKIVFSMVLKAHWKAIFVSASWRKHRNQNTQKKHTHFSIEIVYKC